MPWIDELRKELSPNSFYIKKINFTYSNPSFGVAGSSGIGTYIWNYTAVASYNKSNNDVYKIDSNKNYMFKHNIARVSDPVPTTDTLKVVHFLDDDLNFYRKTSSQPQLITYDYFTINSLNTKFTDNGYLDHYSYYNTLVSRENKRSISYYLTTTGSSSSVRKPKHHIHDFKIIELDFFINGFKRNIYNPVDVKFGDSSGWYYNDDPTTPSYGFKKDNSLSPEDPYYEKDADGNVMCEDNFIATKINSNNFNVQFLFNDIVFPFLPGDSNVGTITDIILPTLDIYLIPSNDFERWRNKESGYEFKLSDYSKLDFSLSEPPIPDLQGYYDIKGLNGKDKYLLLNLVEGETTDTDHHIDMIVRDIKITGEYTDDTKNNVLKTSIPTTSSSSSEDISFEYNNGTNIQTSFIGNGKFLSGVWENGVWNNGVRTDNDSFQFDNVLNSYPISDGKWRIEIGRSSLLSTSERNLVGEFISIGNIVVININEERKFLKKSYLVVDVIDNYIAIEAEFSFPVRRIEKDSDKHRIKVSKNVWLSGAFLSGKFKGIWNDGVFKGNPSNNVMENTQWIDGTFDGGRFISNYNIIGDFYNLSGDFDTSNDGTFDLTTEGISPNEIDNILYAKLSVNNLNIVPLVGDILDITDSKNYNGTSKILEVEQVGSVYNITIDKEYLPEDEIPVFSSTVFTTTGAHPSFSNKLQITYEFGKPTNFSVGNYVNISNVSNSTRISLGLDSDMEGPVGVIVEVLYIEDEDDTTSIGQKIIFDTPVTIPGNVAETSSKSKYPYLSLVKSNLKLLISDGLIQNFTFNDNNLSKFTSNNSISSNTVFKYNSWIDVNYDNNEAVNIGRDTKVNDSITGVNTSNNNLYGYPTSDVLSSKSKFRGSNTLNSKIYNLGTKFKKYTDFLGTASLFEDPFDTDTGHEVGDPVPTPDYTSFTNSGWDFSKYNILDDGPVSSDFNRDSLSFKRTNPSIITEGKELKIKSYERGGVLNNSKITLEKSRYSIIEFDLIDLPSSNDGTTYLSSEDNTYPILSFSNLNYETRADFDDPTVLIHEQPMIYLPINKNVNLLNNPNVKKIEYFFNKKDLMMDIKGYEHMFTFSIGGPLLSSFEATIDNLKIYEVDMIPFFKYFNESNIFKGIQKPLVGTSPFIEYTLNNFPFIESQSIPFDSIDIKTKE